MFGALRIERIAKISFFRKGNATAQALWLQTDNGYLFISIANQRLALPF